MRDLYVFTKSVLIVLVLSAICRAQFPGPPIRHTTPIEERKIVFGKAFAYAYNRLTRWDNPKSEREAERLMVEHFNKYPGVAALNARKGMIALKKTGSLIDDRFYFGVDDRVSGVQWYTVIRDGKRVGGDSYVYKP